MTRCSWRRPDSSTGSVGNGDLEIAAVILSVFQTWGLAALLLETPLDAHRRALVRRFVGLSIQAARGRVDAEDARVLLDRLLTGGGFEFEEFFAHLETLAAASVLLIALCWVTALPRWIRRQIVGLAMATNSFLAFHLIHSTFQSFNSPL
jgi:hypothetical protein